MFKINNNSIITTSLLSFGCFFLSTQLWTGFTSFIIVTIVGFEQVNISRVAICYDKLYIFSFCEFSRWHMLEWCLNFCHALPDVFKKIITNYNRQRNYCNNLVISLIPLFIVSKLSVSKISLTTILPHFSKDPIA